MSISTDPAYLTSLKELLFKMADDSLIMGHRNSEWTGIGPTLEEDIAFASLAQDKVGHAWNLYRLLHDLGEAEPDAIAFNRVENKFKCCHLVELPSQSYDFTLVRHLLFDYAEFLRYTALQNSSYEPLAAFAKKVRPEIKYHIFHGSTWLKNLSKGGEEARLRLQSALNELYPIALSLFEPGPNEDNLKGARIFSGENALNESWMENIMPILKEANLTLPNVEDEKVAFGGRFGYHTSHLQPLLREMNEVFSLDPTTEW